MSLPPDFNPDDPTEVAGGRRFPFHTAGDWVYLAHDPQTGKPIKPAAKALYSTLRMHCNRDRGDDLAWPGTEALAVLLGLSRGDKVTPYLQALARVGAIDVEVVRWGQNNMKRRNLYRVHEAPPEGYQGIATLKQFYAARADLRAEMIETARILAETAGQPGTPENGGTGGDVTSADDPPVPPKTGGPVPPKTGGPEHPFSGGPEHPKTGDQPHEHQNKKDKMEEEAARERAESAPAIDDTTPPPAPSFFALNTLRAIISDAPQTSGRGRDVPELIGDPEVYELARAFDAETAVLAEHRPDRAGGDLALWLGRGLESAHSLYGVLRSRLKPGYATSRMVRAPKPRAEAPQDAPEAHEPDVAATCSVHPGEDAGACGPCAEAEARFRAERAETTRRGAGKAWEALGLPAAHS